jgi:hypothetical protein
MTSDDERDPPKRYLDKGEAIRHLIHAAVRMIAAGEDPFAIHLLIQSAEKLLIDVAKKRGDVLAFDWEDWIKPEYQSEFFTLHRETYNFFKHADRDTRDLPVNNIAEANACFLAMAIENYRAVFGVITEHMKIFRSSRGFGSQNGFQSPWKVWFLIIKLNCSKAQYLLCERLHQPSFSSRRSKVSQKVSSKNEPLTFGRA